MKRCNGRTSWVEQGLTSPVLGLSVEQFAVMRARLDAGQPRPEVLLAVGLDADRSREEEEVWLTRLDEALERGHVAVLRAFEDAYSA